MHADIVALEDKRAQLERDLAQFSVGDYTRGMQAWCERALLLLHLAITCAHTLSQDVEDLRKEIDALLSREAKGEL